MVLRTSWWRRAAPCGDWRTCCAPSGLANPRLRIALATLSVRVPDVNEPGGSHSHSPDGRRGGQLNTANGFLSLCQGTAKRSFGATTEVPFGIEPKRVTIGARKNDCLWPKAAIIGIRPERQLSGDNLPRPSAGIVLGQHRAAGRNVDHRTH